MIERVRPRHEWRLFIAGLALVDAAMIIAAFVLAYVVRFDLRWFALQEQDASVRQYVVVGALALPIWAGIFAAGGLYRRDLLLGGPQEYARLVQACTFGFAAIAVLSFFSSGPALVSRGWLVASWPLAIVATGAGRFVMRRFAYRLRRVGLFIARTVIVGANAQAVAIARQVDRPAITGVQVCGFLDDYLPTGARVDGRWSVLGPPAILPALGVDEAIVVQHALTWESLHEIMRGLAQGAAGPRIRLAPTFFDLLTAGMSVAQRANVPVIAVNRSRIAGMDAVLKTAFEYTLASLLLAALGPVLLWKAARRAGQGRPVLVRRRVVTVGGRTVAVPAFPAEAPETARVRRLVEKGPALLSVLRGDVALIGPRPRPPAAAAAPPDPTGGGPLGLLSVKPGLTGPVSVAGPDLPPEAALALELSYVRNYSIWRDLQIVWSRCRVLLMPAGRTAAAMPLPASDGRDGVAPVPADSRRMG